MDDVDFGGPDEVSVEEESAAFPDPTNGGGPNGALPQTSTTTTDMFTKVTGTGKKYGRAKTQSGPEVLIRNASPQKPDGFTDLFPDVPEVLDRLYPIKGHGRTILKATGLSLAYDPTSVDVVEQAMRGSGILRKGTDEPLYSRNSVIPETDLKHVHNKVFDLVGENVAYQEFIRSEAEREGGLVGFIGLSEAGLAMWKARSGKKGDAGVYEWIQYGESIVSSIGFAQATYYMMQQSSKRSSSQNIFSYLSNTITKAVGTVAKNPYMRADLAAILAGVFVPMMATYIEKKQDPTKIPSKDLESGLESKLTGTTADASPQAKIFSKPNPMQNKLVVDVGKALITPYEAQAREIGQALGVQIEENTPVREQIESFLAQIGFDNRIFEAIAPLMLRLGMAGIHSQPLHTSLYMRAILYHETREYLQRTYL